MRRVAVVSFAQTRLAPTDASTPEMAFEVSRAAVAASGLERGEIGLTVSASSDVLEGRPFQFVAGLEALGAWPATHECHLDMDGAFAAWYAWIKILTGEFDSAVVVAWGKTSEASTRHVLNTQLDPFSLAPLGLDRTTTAALQADAYLTRTGATPASLDDVVDRSRAAAARNPFVSPDERRDGPVASPLWTRHCPNETDGACAIVLAAEPHVRAERPAWITGADHRIESGALGHRDLSVSKSASHAAERARAMAGWTNKQPNVAEVASSFAHESLMLVEALGLSETTELNPTGGPLAADPLFATGLIRLGEAVSRIGEGGTALAHASSGHALQQNVVWLLES